MLILDLPGGFDLIIGGATDFGGVACHPSGHAGRLADRSEREPGD
jgi:hypothetical protein